MLSKKQITRAVTFISVSILSGLSSAISAGLVPEEPIEVQAAVTDTEESTHPIADEKGIKMYKKKKVMYAKNAENSIYLYRDAEEDKDNRVGFGGTVYLAPYQKVTVLANVGSDWYYVKFRCFHHTDGSWSQEKAFVKRNVLKSKLTAYEKDSVKLLKDLGYKHVEDKQYNAVIFID